MRSERRDQDRAKDRPPTATSSYQCSEDSSCAKCVHSLFSAVCECRWSRTWLLRDRCNVSAAKAWQHAEQLRIRTTVRSLWGTRLSVRCFTPRELPLCCGCGGNHTGKYRGCLKWKEAKAALAEQAPDRSRRGVATGEPAAPRAQRAIP